MKKWIPILYILIGICLTSQGYCADNKIVVIPLWKTKIIEGNAVAGDVLNRKTFSTADGVHTGIRPPAPIGTDYVGKGVHPPDPRFEIYTYNAVEQSGYGVKDLMTGLIWMKSPSSSTSTWSDAVESCGNLITTFQVRSGSLFVIDWRLPTVKEMSSLFDYKHVSLSPGMLATPNFFTNITYETYWTNTVSEWFTCTEVMNTCRLFYVVTLSQATTEVELLKPGFSTPPPHYHWCVRGPYGIEY